MTRPSYDLVIQGAGPVGCALALGLRRSRLRILVLEARPRTDTPADRRSIALSWGSRHLLDALGQWPLATPASAIEQVHVSQRGYFGRVLIRASERGVPALGYVAAYEGLSRGMRDALTGLSDCELRQGARVLSTELAPDRIHVRVDDQGSAREFDAAMLVVAEGSADTVVREVDYEQCAIVANVRAQRPAQAVAYERFTADGPIALLPFGEEFALVWTLPSEGAKALARAGADALLASLDRAFGSRLGAFMAARDLGIFPLRLRVAGPPAHPRRLALGNAAQSLHPVAGQGLNLGLRDAAELADQVCAAPGNLGSATLAETYLARRRIDRAATVAATDLLARLFLGESTLQGCLRGAGLAVTDAISPLKSTLAKQMMYGLRL